MEGCKDLGIVHWAELTDSQRSYIAGFFDGEGYIGIARNFIIGMHKKPAYSPQIAIAQKNSDVLTLIKSWIGFGRIGSVGSSLALIISTPYRVSWFCWIVKEFSIVKRPQIETMERFLASSTKNKDKREELYQMIRTQKRPWLYNE